MVIANHEHPRTEDSYQGTVDIFFKKGELREKPYPDHQKTALRVYICTKRLTLERIDSSIVSENEEEQPLIDTWAKRWDANNPWSALMAREEASGNIIGRVVLDYGKQPGHAQLSYDILKPLEGQGYESEMVSPVVREWSELLVERGDLIPSGEDLELYPFEAIDATAIEDTPEAALFDSLMTRVEGEGEEGEIHFEKRMSGDKV